MLPLKKKSISINSINRTLGCPSTSYSLAADFEEKKPPAKYKYRIDWICWTVSGVVLKKKMLNLPAVVSDGWNGSVKKSREEAAARWMHAPAGNSVGHRSHRRGKRRNRPITTTTTTTARKTLANPEDLLVSTVEEKRQWRGDTTATRTVGFSPRPLLE